MNKKKKRQINNLTFIYDQIHQPFRHREYFTMTLELIRVSIDHHRTGCCDVVYQINPIKEILFN